MPGLELVLWVQEHLAWLVPPARAASFLGDVEFYVLVFPALYWSVSRRLGVAVGLVLLVSAGLNATAKLASATPRPFWVSSEVTAHAVESSYGVPSGHAQNAAAVWGRIAAWTSSTAWRAALGLLIVAIAASRWVLGVHVPLDSLAGLAVGGAVLALALALEPRLGTWLEARRPLVQAGVGLAASVALLALGATARWLGPDGPPSAWVRQAAAAGAGEIDPTALDGVATAAGALAGLAIGLAVLRARGGFSVEGSLGARVARYPIGLAGVAVLLLGLDGLLPQGDGPVALAAVYGQFVLIALWIAAGAPLAFRRLRLSDRAAPTAPPPSGDALA